MEFPPTQRPLLNFDAGLHFSLPHELQKFLVVLFLRIPRIYLAFFSVGADYPSKDSQLFLGFLYFRQLNFLPAPFLLEFCLDLLLVVLRANAIQ